MQITLYSGFKKRKNSTLQPPASTTIVPRITLTGHLKEPCTVTEPIINFQGLTGSPAGYTYAYIPTFNRYYWITDWRWNNALWEGHLSVDVLASFRTEIGNTLAYVNRAASDYDGYIIDKMYPAASDWTTQTVALQVPWTVYGAANGTYILGVIRNTPSGSAGGAVTYYAMTNNELTAFMRYLLSDTFYIEQGFDDTATPPPPITQGLAKGLINPFQYIVSCTWFPASKSSFNISAPTTISVGPWEPITGITASYINGSVGYTYHHEQALTQHPQAIFRGGFLNKSPYTTHVCFLPPFGSFMVDTSYFDETNTHLSIDVKVDCITGQATLLAGAINPNDALAIPRIFWDTTAMFGVPIQITQLSSDTLKAGVAAANIVAEGASAAFSGGLSLLLGGGRRLISDVGNAIEALLPRVNTQGSSGSFLAYDDTQNALVASITSRFCRVVDDDIAEMGRPLCQVKRLSDLNGFIQCGEASVDVSALKTEKEAILNFLLGGFYRE